MADKAVVDMEQQMEKQKNYYKMIVKTLNNGDSPRPELFD